MSKTKKYPMYSIEQLRNLLNVGMIGAELVESERVKIAAEIKRREKNDAEA